MSNKFRFVSYAALGLLTIVGGSISANADSQQPITVTVDNQVINFTGTQPTETNGSVLVPLRGVFEALHAHVDYNASDSTITAVHDGRTVVVPIGSNNATIDGQSQQLSQPAEVVNGVTLVPLRFVAEAFGDYVGWDGSSHTVIIQRQHDVNMPDNQTGQAPPVPADVVIGRLRKVLTDQQPPQVVVSVYGQDETIPLSHDVTIERGLQHHDITSASLADLQPDDQVTVHENDHGRAVSIRAIYGN